MSPKFKEYNGFVFKIFSNEEDRKHIHVIKAEKDAKYCLEPNVEIAENNGFNSHELKQIEKVLQEYAEEFKERYAAHISKRIDD